MKAILGTGCIHWLIGCDSNQNLHLGGGGQRDNRYILKEIVLIPGFGSIYIIGGVRRSAYM